MRKRTRKKLLKYFSFFMALNILAEVVSPSVAMALTNGPTQPEHIGFEPAGASEMVDLFTGDFKYNIPLLDVDGYPLNLAYHAGPGMEQEASWVGLGWSLSPGILNRNVRGLPDDFKGEIIQSKTHIRPNTSVGVGFHSSTWFNSGFSFQNPGIKAQLGMSFGAVVNYNNYKGFGLEIELDGNLSLTKSLGSAQVTSGGSIGMSMNSQDGGTLNYNYDNGVGVNFGKGEASVGLSASYEKGGSVNTRTGAMTQTYGYSSKISIGALSIGVSTQHSLPAGPVSYSPRIYNDFENFGIGASLKAGFWKNTDYYLQLLPLPPVQIAQINAGFFLGYKGMYNSNKLVSTSKELESYGYLYSELADYNSLMDYNSFRDGMVMEQTPNINLSNHTYDIFSATAQGVGSNFRSFRSDVGVLHDPVGTTKGKNGFAHLELGFGGLFHMLTNASLHQSDSKSGKWDTQLLTSIPFITKDVNQTSDRFFEKYYFKEMGEISARDAAYEGSVGGEGPISALLQSTGAGFDALSPVANPGRNKRDIRNTYVQALTGYEGAQYGVEKEYNLYSAYIPSVTSVDPNTRLVDPLPTPVSRLTKNSDDISHHLSEMTVTNDRGERYTYGIPVYNLDKKKVMFNASDRVHNTYTLTPTSWFPPSAYSYSAMPLSHKYQMVQYDPSLTGTDLEENMRGIDNFYQHDITPAHATSYLLTSIVSQDYVDVTGDGPSYDDLGNFTKFNYSKEDDYKWREPFCFPQGATPSFTDWQGSGFSTPNAHANYEKGLIADEFDDKAFYEYGTREQYYIQSIETKNYVAFFETSVRLDALGVQDEKGTFANPSSLKLDAIKLFSKSAIIANNGSMLGVTPIKTIYFEYNYSLCPGTFNSDYDASQNPDRGKLTLKKVYFTYGNSVKSGLSPYEFSYDDAFNFNYDPRSVDRWGNYKLNPGNGTYTTGANGTLNNVEFPYSEQDKTTADSYAAAWCLTEIKTPSGAKIDITYESDDYGYVQNEQVAQMLNLKMVRDNINPTDDVTNTYTTNPNIKEANYLVIDLENLHERGIPVNTYTSLGMADAFANKNLIKPGPEHMLYYKVFMKLGGPANSFALKKNYWDFVSGYGEVEEVGVFTSTVSGNAYNAMLDNASQPFYKYAYVKLKKEIAYKSKDVFPITIAGWDFMRNFLPRIAYPGSEPANMGDGSHKPLKIFQNLMVGLGVAKTDFVNGLAGSPNKRFYKDNYCTELDYAKSFVRAFVPLKKKMGGGHRVKKIITDDNWHTMASAEASTTYGQIYDYTMTDGKHTVSSGVAIYEPFVGGDEISLRQPIQFEIEKRFAPNDHFYQETPYAESMYPAPGVGYSKVTVIPLADPGNLSSSGCKIGKTEYEFYSAKNFPVIYSTTGLDKKKTESAAVEEFIAIKKAYKMLGASQGHVIKLNDMHGKLKAISVYTEDNPLAPISKVAYYYKQSGGGKNSSGQLITSALSINENNQISVRPMSRDIDLSVDAKESITKGETFGNTFILEVGMKNILWIDPLCPVVPCIGYVTLPFLKTIDNTPVFGEQKFGLNTTSMTKVVQQYGILDKIETFDNKTKTTVENMLWDSNTGEVLLTKETNHLNQSVYNFNYPAYWPYPQMGHEFRRDNVQILSTTMSPVWDPNSGIITPSLVSNPCILSIGDEVRLYESTSIGVPTYTVKNSIDQDNRFWAANNYTSVVTASPNIANMVFVDKNGTIVDNMSYGVSGSNHYMIKIVKPINKNNMSAKAGYVTSKISPNNGSAIAISTTLNIIDAGVQEFCSGNSIYVNGALTSQSLTNAAPNFTGTTFNEIITGYRGTYRPSSTYKYHVDRNYSSAQPNISSDGYYSDFKPYWAYSAKWTKNTSDGHWIRLNYSKYYSPHGNLLESENANLVSSSQRQAFNHTLPALNAFNAAADEIAFDSFEDYSVYTALVSNITEVKNNDYIGMYSALSATAGSPPVLTGTTTPVSHTGRYSISFAPSNTLTLETDFKKAIQAPLYDADDWTSCAPYVMDCSKLNLRDKKYLISIWVKGPSSSTTFTNLPNLEIRQEVSAVSIPTITTQTPTLVNASPVINGWQKLDFAVTPNMTVPAGPIDYAIVKIKIYSGNSTGFYLDDIRVQPYNSSMTCNVYDPVSLRLWAQMDERNYATVIEYDSEGMVVRKKKETQRGIYTLNEVRKGIVK
jgi:hypothetical protein